MPGDERVARVVREWIARAEDDLKAAAHLLELGKECPTGIVCFHAQQCVEKYLKALLVHGGVAFPKTHDVGSLIALAPTASGFQLSIEEARRMTYYATAGRYPGSGDGVSLTEARRALAVARRVRRTVRSLLPRECLPDSAG